MGKGTFRALVAVAALVPLAVLAGLLAVPRTRHEVEAFFAPLPEARRDGGVATLPSLAAKLGGESNELRTLREDAVAQQSPAPTAVRARPALFGAASAGELPKVAAATPARQGVRRSELVVRDDEASVRAAAFVVGDRGARERLAAAWRRSGRFAIDVTRILHAWKLPDALLAVALVESGFEPALVNGDAVGPWQLPPEIAHVYGLSLLAEYDERRGVASSTEAAARYLADLRERFGTWELALAAYAYGYAPTLEVVTRTKASDLAALDGTLPDGVRRYVAEVLGTATVLDNAEVFGLDAFRREESAQLGELEVPAGTTFALAARAAGITAALLHELNPEYTGEVVPRTSFAMVLRVPSAALVRTRELLPRLAAGDELPDEGDAGPAPESPRGPAPVVSRGTEKRVFYRVREGDTLASLAREHGLAAETIASDNALEATTTLRPGTILTLRVAAAGDAGAGRRNP